MAFVRVEYDSDGHAAAWRQAAGAHSSSSAAPTRFDTAAGRSRAGLATVAVHALLGWMLVARLGGSAMVPLPSAGPVAFVEAISEVDGREPTPPQPAVSPPQPTPRRVLDASAPVAVEPREWSAVDLPPSPATPPAAAPVAAPAPASGQAIGFDPYGNASFFGLTSRVAAGRQALTRQAFPSCIEPIVLDRQVLAEIADAGGSAAKSPEAPAIAAVIGRDGVVLSVEIGDLSRPAAYAHLLVGRRLVQQLQQDRFPCLIKVPPFSS